MDWLFIHCLNLPLFYLDGWLCCDHQVQHFLQQSRQLVLVVLFQFIQMLVTINLPFSEWSSAALNLYLLGLLARTTKAMMSPKMIAPTITPITIPVWFKHSVASHYYHITSLLLYSIVLYCIVLYCIVLYCSIVVLYWRNLTCNSASSKTSYFTGWFFANFCSSWS